jgi:uncharacterized protein YrrD
MFSFLIGNNMNMKKWREVRNLPVIDILSGQHLGYVQDFKTENPERLAGLYMLSLENEIYYIPLDAISRVGRDAVLVKSGFLKKMATQGSWVEDSGLVNSAVLTSSGEVLGLVSDIVIEEKEGNILGYEVTDGYLKDVLWGRKVIATGDILTWGKDTVIVDDSLLD